MLRVYFRYDRGLLNGLCRAAYGAIGTYLDELMGAGYVPGMIVARQTFGEGARFNPHLDTDILRIPVMPTTPSG